MAVIRRLDRGTMLRPGEIREEVFEACGSWVISDRSFKHPNNSSKLPMGSAVLDAVPTGHVWVKAPVSALQEAATVKGELPNWRSIWRRMSQNSYWMHLRTHVRCSARARANGGTTPALHHRLVRDEALRGGRVLPVHRLRGAPGHHGLRAVALDPLARARAPAASSPPAITSDA